MPGARDIQGSDVGAVIVRPKTGRLVRDKCRALLAGSLNDRSTRGLLRAPDGVTLFCRLKLIRSGYLPITLEMRSPLKIALVIIALSVGCSNDGNDPTTATSPSGSRFSVSATDLVFCVTEVNRYRALVGASPLSQSSTAEQTAAEAAQDDHQSGMPHGHYQRTARNYAEVEALRWGRGNASSARSFATQALGQMWAEGPGGGHYEIMRSARYTSTGCGFYGDSTAATFVQQFR